MNWPTLAELKGKQLDYFNAYSHAYEYLKYIISTNIGILVEKVSDYEWGNLKKSLSSYKASLDTYSSETLAEKKYRTPSSLDFIRKDPKVEAERNYYYESILAIVNKYCY